MHDTGVYTYEELHRHFEESEKEGLLYIFEHEHDDRFIMTVESTGVLPAAQIFLNALDIMKQKLDGVRNVEDISEPVPPETPDRNFNLTPDGMHIVETVDTLDGIHAVVNAADALALSDVGGDA